MVSNNLRKQLLIILVLTMCQPTLYGQINAKKSLRETNHQVINLEFSEDGKYLASIGTDKNIILWNTERDVVTKTLSGLEKRPNTVAISGDNEFIFTAGEDRIISMWDRVSMNIIKTFEGHKKAIKAIDISPDGALLASGGEDRIVKIWNIQTGEEKYSLDGHSKDVNALKFSPDGKQLVSGGADGALIMWHVETGSRISRADAHDGWTRCLDYSHDGTMIASGGYDNLIKLWYSDDLEPIRTLEGHSDWVQSVSFSRDDRYLLSGGHDQIIILWDIARGEVVRSGKQGQIVMSVRFHPTKNDFASATLFSEDIKIWSFLMPDTPMAELSEEPEEITGLPERVIQTMDSIPAQHPVIPGTTDSLLQTPQFPSITLFSPEPVSGYVKHDQPGIFLIGKAEDPEGINVFLVNKEVVTLSQAGVFQYNLDLKYGMNQVELVAINNKGKMNRTRLTIECTSKTAGLANQAESNGIPGKYYALIIGINDYQDPDIPSLDNPIKDAEAFYDVLVSNYSFLPGDILLLKNPSRMNIIEALDEYSRNVTPEDNLLIFYAGHGHWDEKSGVGYWLPSDASKKSSVNWFRNSTLRDFIGSIQSKHTLLIADACFSGAIFSTRAAFTGSSAGIQKLYELPSRKAMTSGLKNEEVPDESVFIKYLISRLEENKEPHLPSEVLFSSFKPAVLNNSPNVPLYGTIQNVGDEGGDFIFIRK